MCLSVSLSLAVFQHYCTNPDVISENGRGCPLVVHNWADLQSVHGFMTTQRRTRNVSECLYSLYARLIHRPISHYQPIGPYATAANNLILTLLPTNPTNLTLNPIFHTFA